jgi:formylglycine-generating enzyme required for sulfatase activity
MRPSELTLLTAVALTTVSDLGANAAPVSEVACHGDGTRVALLIGNQDYVGTMQPLDNPRRDIAALGALLCQHGFTVFRHADLDVNSFDATIETFARAAKGTKTALVYYSGHGFAVGRRNWLVPVDARLGCEDISGDERDATRLQRRLVDLDENVLARLEGAGDQIVILDACRTDPVRDCRGGATPSLIKGLVRTNASNARLIVYATQDGQVALDKVKGSETSPLITAMLRRLPENPRRDWVTAMLSVSAEVHALTDRRQRPNIDVSLAPHGCLAPECKVLASPQPAEDPDAAVRRDYQFAEKQDTSEVWEEFLRKHPSGLYAAAARQRLARLIPPVQPVTPPTPVQPTMVSPPVAPALPPDTKPKPAVGVFVPAPGVAPLSPERERALKPKDSFKECDRCPEMIMMPIGEFTMGAPSTEPEREPGEVPQHRVALGKPSSVSRFAVTFDEWDACVKGGGCSGYTPWDNDWGRGRRPVINVSWNDAKSYVAWLSQSTGKAYRLLSEAEREFVTRAGTITPFWWGKSISTRQANYNGNDVYAGGSKGEYRKKTLPVDSFEPNSWGLYQVHGNVWEWIEDCLNDNYRGAPSDGSPWLTGDCSRRGLRGGSWVSSPGALRSAGRYGIKAQGRVGNVGFRVARTLSR